MFPETAFCVEILSICVMVCGVSSQVAIVMSEVFLRRLTPALAPFVRREQDYRILNIDRPHQELKRRLKALQPDGIITEWLPQKTEPLLDLGLPTVIVDTDFCYRGVVSVDVDDWAVGREAARAFQQAGLHHFACLGNGEPYSDQRLEGFRLELGKEVACSQHTETGFSGAHYSESFTNPGSALRSWLKSLPKPVGIFAVHDPLGRYLCSACHQLGIRIPDEVAIIGANNDELVCGLTHPMLSSIAIPWDRIGEVAGRTLQDWLAGHPTETGVVHLVPPSGMVLRHSANHLTVDDPMLRRAMSFLSERLPSPVNISFLCRELRVSRRTLERRFREYYQCTPWEMLCLLRVNQSKRLLSETHHPISRIAELCGFNDPEQMSVVFKRLTGMPPSHYRRSRTQE